jgi:hypothetical protein
MGLTNDVMACINKTACGDEPNVKNENIAVERQQMRQRQEIEESQKKEVTKINMDDYLVPFKKKIDELCEKRDKAEHLSVQMVEMLATILVMNIKLNWKLSVLNVEEQ